MNKKITYILPFFVAGLSIGFFFFHENIADALGNIVSRRTSAAATTTLAYVGEGVATTTFEFDNSQTNQTSPRYLLVQGTASSSANTMFRCKYSFSNDEIDWYDETTDNFNAFSTFGDNFRHSTSTPIFHLFGAATTSEMGAGNDVVKFALEVPPVIAHFGRVSCDTEPNGNSVSNTAVGGYTSPIGAANGALWFDATLNEEK